jgi:hypothetical protein
MKKELVLGLAAGYSWETVRVFVLSLRRSGFSGDIVLFVGEDIDAPTIAMLRQYGVRFISVGESSPYLRNSDEVNYPPRDILRRFPNSVVRILVYYNFLLENRDSYSTVLVADVRDVVFQQDPFSFDWPNKLCVFFENAGLRIGNSNWNAIWMIMGFGVSVFYELKDNTIACFGTVLGPVEEMIPCFERMLARLAKTAVAMQWGVEQAVYNYLILKREIPEFCTFTSEDGPIVTIGRVKYVDRNEQGLCINSKGEVYHVVHQYDRLQELNDFYSKRFGDTEDVNAPSVFSPFLHSSRPKNAKTSTGTGL